MDGLIDIQSVRQAATIFVNKVPVKLARARKVRRTKPKQTRRERAGGNIIHVRSWLVDYHLSAHKLTDHSLTH
jgi:hypothetical protein